MKTLLKTVSYLGLVGLLLFPVLYFTATIDKPSLHTGLIISTVLWFASAPFWLNRKAEN